MASSIVGIDIGSGNCKAAVREGDAIRLISSRMPENMMSEGQVVAPESMSHFLKQIRSQEHIHTRNCALVLSESQAYFRHVTLPAMNVAELKLNLPYEFRDFIEGDPGDYNFDYMVDQVVENEEGKPSRLELFAAAVKKSLIEEDSQMLRKAGLKLKLVIPAQMAYTRIMRAHIEANPIDEDKTTVLVDFGHADVSVMLFHGSHYEASKTIEFGCDEFDMAIADMKGIDQYTASSYKATNFEGVMDSAECQTICDRFGVEVSKVVNFYNFNNPEKDVDQMFMSGGGAQIPQLVKTVSDMVSVPADSIDFLLPAQAKGSENGPVCALAIGAMMEAEVM